MRKFRDLGVNRVSLGLQVGDLKITKCLLSLFSAAVIDRRLGLVYCVWSLTSSELLRFSLCMPLTFVLGVE